MNAIEILISKLKKVDSKIEDIAISELKKESKLLAQLNRDQLDRGETSKGANMPPYVDTSKGNIRLEDTGDWWAGIAPEFDSDGIDMTSSNYKTGFLDPKYPNALGVRQSIGIVLNKIKPRIVKRLKAEL